MPHMWKHKIRHKQGNRPSRKRPLRRFHQGEIAGLELLDRRLLPAITASFSAVQGIMTIIGDSQNNTIVLSRDAAGTILVNNGAVSVLGSKPTVANTTLIQLFGLDGNDNLSLNEANGALPKANIFGGN